MLTELSRAYKQYGRTLRSPSFWLVANYHWGRWVLDLPEPARRIGSMVYGVLSTGMEFLLGSTLYRETEIGPDLHIIHGDGVRIAPSAKLGSRVGIMHGVTIGTAPDRSGAPEIGDDVFIGAGARILGPVKVGARARIAANSLVVTDVPPDTTAIGVPARVLRYTGRSNSTGLEPVSAPPEPNPADPADTGPKGSS